MKIFKTPISKIVLIFSICFISFASQPLLAQPGGFEDDTDDETLPVPINGLVALGLVAGAFYGVKKLKK